jgi:acid phosphatase class B
MIAKLLFALSVVTALSACTNTPKGIRVVNGGTSAVSAQEGQPIRNLSAAEITSAISGKTFQYTRSDGNGFVTYNADGTLNFQDDTRGEGTGSWTANSDQYCETFGAGKPQECGIFKSTGDAFFAANSRLVEMKV